MLPRLSTTRSLHAPAANADALAAPGGLVAALLDVPSRYASAARSSRARLASASAFSRRRRSDRVVLAPSTRTAARRGRCGGPSRGSSGRAGPPRRTASRRRTASSASRACAAESAPSGAADGAEREHEPLVPRRRGGSIRSSSAVGTRPASAASTYVPRVADVPVAERARLAAQAAVRPGAEAEVALAVPVEPVVDRLVARAREVRDLVAAQAGAPQRGADRRALAGRRPRRTGAAAVPARRIRASGTSSASTSGSSVSWYAETWTAPAATARAASRARDLDGRAARAVDEVDARVPDLVRGARGSPARPPRGRGGARASRARPRSKDWAPTETRFTPRSPERAEPARGRTTRGSPRSSPRRRAGTRKRARIAPSTSATSSGSQSEGVPPPR